MSQIISFNCDCGAKLKAKQELAGRRARCKKCGQTLTIPTARTNGKTSAGKTSVATSAPQKTSTASSSPAKSATAKKTLASAGIPNFVSSLEKSSADKTISEVPVSPLAKTCPECKSLIGDLVVCIRCGYHTKLKRKLQVMKKEDVKKRVVLALLLLVPLYAVFPLLTFATLESLEGPAYLGYFFAAFCISGLATILLRQLWFDHDVFNYVALAGMEIGGGIRLFNALYDGNFRVSFLVIGMIAVSLAFLLPRTENSNTYSESFRSKCGGLATIPTATLLAFVAIGLGTLYFVPVVSTIVAAGAWPMTFGLGALSFGTLNPEMMTALGGTHGSSRYDNGWGGCSSYGSCGSSCGSSCGGGCGGGGCGGCGG